MISYLNLGALSKRRKAIISFMMSVYTDLYKILYLSTVRKSAEKLLNSPQSDKNKEYFTNVPMYIFIYLAEFFLEWVTFHKFDILLTLYYYVSQ
jgi:hypothetical protein